MSLNRNFNLEINSNLQVFGTFLTSFLFVMMKMGLKRENVKRTIKTSYPPE